MGFETSNFSNSKSRLFTLPGTHLSDEPEKVDDNDNIFVIPEKKNFEKYLCCPEYQETIVKAIIKTESVNKNHQKSLEQQWTKKDNILNELFEKLSGHKTKYAAPVAEAISGLDDEKLRYPLVIRSLLAKVAEVLSLPSTNTETK